MTDQQFEDLITIDVLGKSMKERIENIIQHSDMNEHVAKYIFMPLLKDAKKNAIAAKRLLETIGKIEEAK